MKASRLKTIVIVILLLVNAAARTLFLVFSQSLPPILFSFTVLPSSS